MTEEGNGARRQIDVIIAELKFQTAQILKAVMELKLYVMGDGTKDNPGVIIRLDRLEQKEETREEGENSTKAWRLGLLASVILLFLERAWHWISLLKVTRAGH